MRIFTTCSPTRFNSKQPGKHLQAHCVFFKCHLQLIGCYCKAGRNQQEVLGDWTRVYSHNLGNSIFKQRPKNSVNSLLFTNKQPSGAFQRQTRFQRSHNLATHSLDGPSALLQDLLFFQGQKKPKHKATMESFVVEGEDVEGQTKTEGRRCLAQIPGDDLRRWAPVSGSELWVCRRNAVSLNNHPFPPPSC